MFAFRDLVLVLLGQDAVADDKTECNNPLTILGIDVLAADSGFSFTPFKGWLATITEALAPGGVLTPGDAAKFAGGLSWGSRAAFRRFGRAMLGPLHHHSRLRYTSSCLEITGELRRALQWWADVLQAGLAETHVWKQIQAEPLHVFCDASGTSRRLGVVLRDKNTWYWTTTACPHSIQSAFQFRRDKQIMGLELLAISFALSTFIEHLRNRVVVIHCDNKGAEVHHPPPAFLSPL